VYTEEKFSNILNGVVIVEYSVLYPREIFVGNPKGLPKYFVYFIIKLLDNHSTLLERGSFSSKSVLKVLTNEKRGRSTMVLFDRSHFKLFSLRFSNKSVQAPSCERPKTTQRTLFLSFEINNCIPISA
jgi:hypothetical protein